MVITTLAVAALAGLTWPSQVGFATTVLVASWAALGAVGLGQLWSAVRRALG
jgi:hypothetical protein